MLRVIPVLVRLVNVRMELMQTVLANLAMVLRATVTLVSEQLSA
ncbi:hypothetical protein ACFLZ3_03580 [Candidatus Omnitrophota bacterium]